MPPDPVVVGPPRLTPRPLRDLGRCIEYIGYSPSVTASSPGARNGPRIPRTCTAGTEGVATRQPYVLCDPMPHRSLSPAVHRGQAPAIASPPAPRTYDPTQYGMPMPQGIPDYTANVYEVPVSTVHLDMYRGYSYSRSQMFRKEPGAVPSSFPSPTSAKGRGLGCAGP